MNSPAYVASENIGVALFVNILSGTDHQIEVCDAGDIAIGVSANYPQSAVLPGESMGPAAVSGSSCRVFGLGEMCEVTAGGSISAGAYLKPDADGKAVTCSSTNPYSAIARAGASSGEMCQVVIRHGVAP